MPLRVFSADGALLAEFGEKRRVPLTVRLLSPAQRPIQITSDLAAFWQTTYRQVKKELAGRYPKHDWPERP